MKSTEHHWAMQVRMSQTFGFSVGKGWVWVDVGSRSIAHVLKALRQQLTLKSRPQGKCWLLHNSERSWSHVKMYKTPWPCWAFQEYEELGNELIRPIWTFTGSISKCQSRTSWVCRRPSGITARWHTLSYSNAWHSSPTSPSSFWLEVSTRPKDIQRQKRWLVSEGNHHQKGVDSWHGRGSGLINTYP